MKRLLLVFVLCSGCLLPESPRRYPAWERTTEGAQVLADCAEVDAWVSKSGKEGVGVSLELRGRSTVPCVVTITAARLRVGGEEHVAQLLPPPPTLRLGQRVHAYLAFPFDGDRAWNAGVDGALTVSASQRTVTFPLRQTMPKREDCEPR